MGAWETFKNWITYQPDENVKGEVRSLSGTNFDFTKWHTPKNIFEGTASDTLANNETVFAAVTRLSNTMASLPLNLNENYRPITDGVGALMKFAPNKNMTSFQFIRLMEAKRSVHGNAYAIKQYDDKYQVVSLDVLDNYKVTPVMEEKSGDLYYEVQGVDGKYYVHNGEIIHLTHIHTTGHQGISPLDVLRNTIDYEKKIKTFSLSSIENNLKAGFVLKMSTNMSDDKKKATLDSFKSFYQNNGGGVIILDNGSDLKEISKDFIDMKVFEVEKITKARVANVFNIPVHFLGEQGGSFSSMEQQALEYAQNTILPIVRQYEQEFNRKLLTESERKRGREFKFNLNGLLRADTATRGEFYFKGVRSGWFTLNEIRAWEELPPVTDGENLFVSGDLYKLSDIVNRPEMTNTAVKGGDNNESNEQETTESNGSTDAKN